MSATTSTRTASHSAAPPRWQCGPRLFSPGALRAHTDDTPMSAKLPHAQRRFRARRHVRRIASVICPRHTAHPNGSRTNERETAARAAPLSDAPPRWRRGLGSFTPARSALIQTTHQSARNFRTRSAALGRAAALALWASVIFPRFTARPNGSRTNERETSARAAPLSGAPPRWQFGPR